MRQPDSALLAGVAVGDLDGVRAALANGADPAAENEAAPLSPVRAAIHEAASNGHAAVIRLLAAAGADVNANASTIEYSAGRSFTALHLAAIAGHADALRALLEAGANPNRKGEGQMPLHA